MATTPISHTTLAGRVQFHYAMQLKCLHSNNKKTATELSNLNQSA